MLSFYLSLPETPQAQAAFSQLYHAHYSKLLRIARLLLRDDRKAEDAVHDTFVKIIEHFEIFLQIPCKNQEAWIVTILKNTCLDQIRREKKHIPQDIDEILFSLPDLRQDVEADVRFRQLRDVMKQLSADDRELLALVRQVMADENLKYCPHGRPICITLSKKQLEKQFRRT